MGPPPGPVTRKGPHVTQTPPWQAWVACLGLAPSGQTLAHSRPKTSHRGQTFAPGLGGAGGDLGGGGEEGLGVRPPVPSLRPPEGWGRPRGGGGLPPLPQPTPPPRGPS